MLRFAARIVKDVVRACLCWYARAEPLSEGERQHRWRHARRVLVLSAAGIGDALMATPLLLFLQQRRPSVRLGILTHTRAAPVFQAFPEAELICYSERAVQIGSFLRALWRCRQFRADIFLGAQPCNTLRHALLAAASRARLRLRHAPAESTVRKTACIYHYLCPTPEGRHRVELNLDLFRALGEQIPEGSLQPFYPVTESLRERVRRFLPSHLPCVALHPGSGRSEKRWAIENFATLARWLYQQGYHIVLVGGPGEEPLGAQIAAESGVPVTDLIGRLEFAETAAVLQSCRLVVCNDSGMMHVAVAVGTPVVAIFVATDPARIGPYSPRATSLGNGRGSPPTIEEVIAAVQYWLHPGTA